MVTDQVLQRLGLPAPPEALPAPTVDAHTHLDATRDHSRLPVADNLRLAAATGIDRVVQIGCDVPSSRWAVELAAGNPQVIAAVAIHPNDAARMSDDRLEKELAIIESLAGAGPHVRAVGETGLDFYRTREPAGIARQHRSFARHIAIARQRGHTLVIHDRDAHTEIAELLDAEGWPERVVFHCFSGDAGFARRVLDRGAWLSFAGNITYRANHGLRAALALTPPDRVLIETDAPYLTPLPHRGRPNASYLMAHTAAFVAAQLGLELDAACRRFADNAAAAFGGTWGIPAADAAAPGRCDPTDTGAARDTAGQVPSGA